MKKKYDEKRKRVVGCHRQPEGWRGKIRLYGTAGQCPALPHILKGQSDFNEYYEECLYKLTDLDYFCTRN